MNQYVFSYSGMFTTAVRWVAGWTYFSAFWRRLILENKLQPEEAGYIGEKFNHFLPQALGIKPLIEHLVSNPEQLWWAMSVFTVIEGIVGLFFMAGLFTRLMSAGVFSLALGILLGSGWLGTTCLDEWQIGVLGVAAGFVVWMSGGGMFSLDQRLILKAHPWTRKKWWPWLASGTHPFSGKRLVRWNLWGAITILFLTLFTNQYFHGGVWGQLHNLSVKPHVTITDARVAGDELSFTVFRDEGADVYGSFLIKVEVMDTSGRIYLTQDMDDLSSLHPGQIQNEYVAKVRPGKHSLILPLGARARLTFPISGTGDPDRSLIVKLTDISGAVWTAEAVMTKR